MFNLSLDDADLQGNLRQLSDRQIKWAAKDALDKTAGDVLAGIHARMDAVFDCPTPFTKRAFVVQKAHTERLEAVIHERPRNAARDYLKVQEGGGLRPTTGLETVLRSRLAYDGTITAVTPAPFAKLNAYGNWDSGERNKVMSGLKAQRDAWTNTTPASRRRKRRKAGFFVPKAESRLPKGVWMREADGTIYQILRFTRVVPQYQPRLGFYDGADDAFRLRLPGHLRREIAARVARLAVKAGS